MLRSTHGGWARRRRALVVSLAAALGAATLTTSAPAAAGPLPTPAPAQPVDVSSSLTAANPAVTTFTGERFADTRPGGATIDGTFLGAGPRPAGTDYEVQIAGRGSVPAGADSVVINLTALAPAAKGYFTAYECAPALPIASGLNFAPGIDVANEIVVKLSAIGTLCVFNSAEAGVLIDVVGFISATDSVKTMTQKRFAESRVGAPTFDGQFQGFGRTAPGSITPIKIAGRDGVPPTFSAVIANVAVVDPASDGFVTVYGCLPTVPTASSINHTAGVNIANELIVQPDANGEICVFTQKDVDLIVDVVGFVETGSDLVSTSNARYFESRSGATTFDGQSQGGGILAAGSTAMVQIGGRGAVPSDAATAVVNVAAVDPADNGFFTVYPCSDPQPNSSSLNYTTGVNGANELIADLDATGKLCVFTSASAHLLVDVVGYVNPNADLSITKTDSDDPVVAGTTLTYTVEVSNDGPHTATDVVVTDTLPAEVTLVSTSGCAEDPNGVPTCSLGDIAAGASAAFTVETTVNLGTSGTITNTAAVDSSTGDPDVANNSVTEDTTAVLPATVIVEKQTIPDGATGTFTFTGDVAGPLSDDGTITVAGLAPGTYTSTESDPTPGFDLTDLTCDDGNSTGSTVTRTASFQVEEGETVTCTFTNTERGTIKIVKASTPTGGTGFGYAEDITSGGGTFSLDDGQTETFLDVVPGTYTVTEDDPTPGYDLTGLTCDDGTSASPSTTDIGNREATVELDPGETVTCTFGNTERGTINIVKASTPTGGTGFGYAEDITSGGGTFSLDDGQTETFLDVVPGTYTVTEDDPTPGYDLTGLTCDDGTSASPSTTDIGNREATVELDPGETVTCTFGNTERGTIKIVKASTPTGGTGFGFTDDIPGSGTFTLDDGQTETFTNIVAGTYTVTEDDPTPGYDLTGLTCVDSDTGGTASTGSTTTRAATINLDPGETVTCTYTNTQRGTIQIVKASDPTGGTGFGFTDDIPGSGTFTLDDGQTETFTNIVAGTYTVTEDDPTPGYDLTGLTCVDSDTGGTASTGSTTTRAATINLDPGETVTCTYTNTQRGTIQIVKASDPTGGTGFGFTDDIPGSGTFTLDDGQTETFTNIVAGTYTVTEDDPTPGYDLTGLTCVDSDTGGTASTGSTTTRAATINLDPGETVTCTYTNTQRGTIQIVKDTVPNDAQDFDYTTTGGLSPSTFTLDDDAGAVGEDATYSNTQTFTDVLPGTYTVTEGDPTPAFLTAIVCVDSDAGGTPSSVVVVTRVATIELDPGETVTCTYTNAYNTPPTLDLDADNSGGSSPDFSAAFTEGTAASVADDVDITDGEDANMAAGAVTITNVQDVGVELVQLNLVSCAPIVVGGNGTAAVTLTGPATIAEFEACFATATYDNTSDDPTASPDRTIDFVVNDGTVNSTARTTTVTVAAVNDPPVLASIEAADVAYTENDPATQITNTITVADPDDTNLESAAIQITGNFQVGGEDLLAANGTLPATITAGAFNTATGILTLTGTATLADYQTALRAITYANTSNNPDTSDRTVTFTANDGTANSNTQTRDITVAAVNDPPVLASIEAADVAYTENDPATQITNMITVADPDDTNLESATIQITGNLQTGGEDILADDGSVPVGITVGAFNTTTGIITLTGTASLADYQTALRAITYANTSNDPDTSDRTVTFTAHDGTVSSNTQTRDITVAAVNDPPTLTAPGPFDSLGNVGIDVPAANGLLSATITDPDFAGPFTISGVDDSLTLGTVVVAATGAFTYTPAAGFSGPTDTFAYQVCDNGTPLPSQCSTVQTVTINITDVVWFIDNNLGAAGNGTLATPFNTLAAFETLNGNGGGTDPGAGDTIFMYTGSGDYSGGVTLENTQRLVGQGSSATLPVSAGITEPTHSNTLPTTGGTDPVIIDATGNGITLGSANTIRGLNVGNTPGGHGVAGGAVGALTLSEVDVSGTGGIVEVATSGDLTDATFGMMASTSTAAASGDAGIALTGVTGTFGGSPTIAGSDGAGIDISGSSATFTFPTISVSGTGGAGVELTNNTSTIDINGGSITTTTGIGFDVNGSSQDVSYAGSINNASSSSVRVRNTTGATVDLSGTITDNGAGISIANNGGGTTATFSGANTVLNTAGSTALNLVNNTGSFVNFTGGGLDIDTTSGVGLGASGGGTVTMTGAGNTINTTIGGRAVNMSGVAIGAADITFSQIDKSIGGPNNTAVEMNAVTGDTFQVTGATNVAGTAGVLAGINIVGSSATFTFGSVDIDNTGGPGINLSGANGVVSVNGGTIDAATGNAVDVDQGGNNVTVAAAITNSAARAVEVTNRTGGTVAFTGAVVEAGTGIRLDANGGGTVNFSGGLTLNTGANTAFSATTSGTVNVTGSPNTIGATTPLTDTAVNISDTTIGASGVTFRSIAVDAGAAGADSTAIILDDTGAGAFTVTGDGSTGTLGGNASGGIIQNLADVDAITLNNTDGVVTLQNMTIRDIGVMTGVFDTRSQHDGIHGATVDGGLTLNNVTIDNISDMAINGAVFTGGSAGIGATTWTGLTITDSIVTDANRHHIASVLDDSDEGSIRINGIRGTVTIDESEIKRGGELIDFFVTGDTLNMTVTDSEFDEAYQEYTSGGVSSKGKMCIDVTVQGTGNANVTIGSETDTAVGHQANDGGNDFGHCKIASIRVANDAGATGTINSIISNNTVTVTDHSSGVGGDFDFPQSGIKIMTRGEDAATNNAVISYNKLDEVTRADGGLGQVTLDLEDGAHQVRVDHNNFDTPGEAAWYVRADSSVAAAVLFDANTYTQGFFSCPDPSCGGGYTGPGQKNYADMQNGGNLDLTIRNETYVAHDPFFGGLTIEVRGVNVGGGGNADLFYDNVDVPEGFQFRNEAGTIELHSGASATTTGNCTPGSVTTCQTVLVDNSSLGGGGSTATNPPTVIVTSTPGPDTVTITSTAPSLPAGGIF